MNNELLQGMTAQQKKELLAELKREERRERASRREAYEGIRAQFMQEVKGHLAPVVLDVCALKKWLDKECQAIKKLMCEYGQLRSESQGGFTMIEGNFKLEVKANKVKGFDERADLAAERLVDYLKRYVSKTEKGTEDPMYQLAMTLLERNKAGDLDYKSISKLYELEGRFDEEYAEIMELFKESNIVQKNAVNYYFYELDTNGVWRKVEPSFCRL